MIKINSFRNSSNKQCYAYILTPEGLAKRSARTAGFLKAQLREHEGLKTQMEAPRADLDGSDLQGGIHG